MTGKGGIFNILIILAVLMAVLSIYLVNRMVNSAREEALANAKPPEVEMVNVYVTARNIEPGSEMKPELVKVKSVPKEFTTSETVTSLDQLKDKVAGTFMPADDLIFTSKVKNPDQMSKASLVVEKGKRLVSVPSDFEIAVSYMVKNGDNVDILATFDVPKVEKDVEGQWMSREITVTLLQNVKIFDIQFGAASVPSKNASNGSGGPGGSEESGRLGKGQTVTFEVSPEEAERLTAAFSKAKKFRLSLRRWDDTAIAKTSSMMETELLRPFLPAAPEPPPPPKEEVKPAPAKPKYNY